MRYLHVPAESAETHRIEGGETTKILATASETDGRVSVFDSNLPGGNEAPLHYHEIDEEIFYIVSGEVEFQVAQEQFIARQGDLVIAGTNIPRSFKALVDSHVIVINSPAGPSEGFIREIAKIPATGPTDEDKARFIDRYKIHIVDR